MLRRLIKTGIANGLHWSGADQWLGSHLGLAHGPLIICYHRVVEDFNESALKSIDPMLVSSRTLERHLDWIGKRYEFITLDELSSKMEAGDNFKKPVAAVTFDDGYSDVYENGYPLLKRKGIPSAIFVVTEQVGTTYVQIHDELYLWIVTATARWKNPAQELGLILGALDIEPSKVDMLVQNLDDPYVFTRLCLHHFCQRELKDIVSGLAGSLDGGEDDMFGGFYSANWEMLREMSHNDVTIGSHTKTHALLVNETSQKVQDETAGSRLTAEQELGIPVKHFAYPDGQFNSDVVQSVKQAGYSSAYTICTHKDEQNPMLTIPRKVLWENTNQDVFNNFSPAILSCQVNGVFDRVKTCAKNHV